MGIAADMADLVQERKEAILAELHSWPETWRPLSGVAPGNGLDDIALAFLVQSVIAVSAYSFLVFSISRSAHFRKSRFFSRSSLLSRVANFLLASRIEEL